MADLYVLDHLVTAWVSLQVGVDIMIAGSSTRLAGRILHLIRALPFQAYWLPNFTAPEHSSIRRTQLYTALCAWPSRLAPLLRYLR